jgi:hypothetical protein
MPDGPARYKHSSLLQTFVHYNYKKFCNIEASVEPSIKGKLCPYSHILDHPGGACQGQTL